MNTLLLAESITWLILCGVVVTVFLQYATKQNSKHLIVQNELLTQTIMELQAKIHSLNTDLSRISAENAILRRNIKELQDRVNALQTNILKCEKKA